MTGQQFRHNMLVRSTHDETARQSFVENFRLHLAAKAFAGNRTIYDRRVEPMFVKEHGRKPADRHEIRRVMTEDADYQLWSAMQRSSQEMMWDSVIDSVEHELPDLVKKSKSNGIGGTLTLDHSLAVPNYLTAHDIHLQPGGYHSEVTEDDVTAGAIYDRSLFIYGMGSLGAENDDLGQTTLSFYKSKFSDHQPERIVELGCTIGNSLIPWARAFPNAEAHGLDVAAPCLRYGHARAEALGIKTHFGQQDVEHMSFDDSSVDIVVSHFFMHETSRKALPQIFSECYRVLKPGGLMLHLDVVQDQGMAPLDSFFVEWEVYNNNEPFMGEMRDMDLTALAQDAGFRNDNIEHASHSSQTAVHADDGYINFFTWPIFTAVK